MAKRNRWGRKLGDLCKTKGNGSATLMESARLIGGGPLTLDHIASGKRLAVIQRYPPLTTVGIIERDRSIFFLRSLLLFSVLFSIFLLCLAGESPFLNRKGRLPLFSCWCWLGGRPGRPSGSHGNLGSCAASTQRSLCGSYTATPKKLPRRKVGSGGPGDFSFHHSPHPPPLIGLSCGVPDIFFGSFLSFYRFLTWPVWLSVR